MVGEANEPNEHEVRMATSEHKFDDLLAFVHMMVKQVAEMGNQKRKDGKNTNSEVSEGRPHIIMDPLPRPPTPPKPEGRDPQLDSKIDGLEEKIQLMRGLSSFETQIPSMAQFANNETLLIQTFQDTLMGHAVEWYSQLMKISHWKELADTFLAQKNRGCGAVKTKRMVDMPALMALVEQIAKRTLVEKNEGRVQDDSQERQEMVEDSSMLYSPGISQASHNHIQTLEGLPDVGKATQERQSTKNH
uniref:Retrotransposon gag domain-containing protein n=1 Tax=Fagus sylvatica TaxID=28930 RepID=A0A2N9GVU0_FAGSY